MTSLPTVGVEEEFLLVDAHSGEPAARNRAVAEYAAARGVKLQLELTSCQVETTTDVMSTSDELRAELSRLRRVATEAAEANRAHLLAVALPPTVPHKFPVTTTPRYCKIADRFGMIAHEQGICGCHVHVAVPSREAAIEVSNRIRPYLHLLLALTANSAIYRNSDSGYASFRSMLWTRWPSSGPPPYFESAAHYDSTVEMLLQAGAVLDPGMIYWDVRPSANFPTVEVRVADIPATVAETVLLATLIRAVVMTALHDLEAGENTRPAPTLTDCALRAAHWKAARDGLDGEAIDLLDSHGTAPTRVLLAGLIEHVRPALEELGDYDMARDELARISEEGNGAIRQRRAWRRRREVADVIAELATATTTFD
ncbi:carboxylate-amine ligase [Mycolicibacterium mageritense DSM 44476 = CIP 104973]|uniref:Putative glutamate--cysteine ligase 2 n=1 Tax=Mycolicibacterium mageritense TaxID=53462 RepID=A0ABN5Y0I5_MYCME|nr:glutamate--cysteine ligase [Mycolicibacterium mageritense]MCC9180152.1 glutamate--cysteine ligase [Mycolicibacterium mageritense]BBX31698.1 putative glutamate--cysteine ligase 2 [Mycolicibacterium mageritense]CDO23754.1 carboxylate-amine ligase [Mycolicibacterium mageritense DSM 44476 = CIP 104973]